MSREGFTPSSNLAREGAATDHAIARAREAIATLENQAASTEQLIAGFEARIQEHRDQDRALEAELVDTSSTHPEALVLLEKHRANMELFDKAMDDELQALRENLQGIRDGIASLEAALQHAYTVRLETFTDGTEGQTKQ